MIFKILIWDKKKGSYEGFLHRVSKDILETLERAYQRFL